MIFFLLFLLVILTDKHLTFPVNLMKYRCIKGLNNGRCCSNLSLSFLVDFPYISPYAALRGINL